MLPSGCVCGLQSYFSLLQSSLSLSRSLSLSCSLSLLHLTSILCFYNFVSLYWFLWYGGGTTTTEEVSRFQCLFPNPNLLVWKGIPPPKTLDTVKPSATGLDKIPSWFLRIAAPRPLISVPTAYIFNTSLSFSAVPDQWKSSSIIPVPKITSPLTSQDFRSIFSHACAS